MAASFESWSGRHGLLADLDADEHPGSVRAWVGGSLELPDGGTHFGFVLEAEATLRSDAGEFRLGAGMYFSASGPITIWGEGSGLVVTRRAFEGLFLVGGPIEERGRLRYIDGCTDSLLVGPVVLGDPCLNLLHIPAGTFQSEHHHPSYRAGVVVSGSGECVTPEGRHPLSPGTFFVIAAGGRHSFVTRDEALRVIAYHPDSDFGPTHEDHPMVNRTLLAKADSVAS